MEIARDRGLSTGNVSTAEITDATPAGPSSHISQRGCQGPNDTRSACPGETKAAGGLGSIGCAMMPPELAAKTIRELRALTDKPINVNFSCHIPAKADADRERAWSHRLLPFYRELGVDDQEPRHPRLDIAPFDGA